MELLIIFNMERLGLRVQTVPMLDPVFCKCFRFERETVCIQRPFVPQSIFNYE